MAKQILKDEQLVSRERPTVPVLLGDEYAKGWREPTANEGHGHRFTRLVDEERLLPLDQQSLEHQADAKIGPIDQAKVGERVSQERVPGDRLVVKDVLGCDARDEPTAIPNLEPI